MEKLEIKTQFKVWETKGEVNKGISETIPNQALTVRQILERYASGTLMPVSFNLDYSEDLPDIRFLDITELDILAEENSRVIDEHRAKEAKAKQDKLEADRLELEKFRNQQKLFENGATRA